jgi:hypothetical protein
VRTQKETKDEENEGMMAMTGRMSPGHGGEEQDVRGIRKMRKGGTI